GGGLLVCGAGLAGEGRGDISVEVPGMTFSGSFRLAVNQTNTAVDSAFSVGGSDVTLTLAAGPYLRIEGTGVQLVVAGQALTADVAFERVTDLGSDGLPGGTDSAADSSIIRVGVANLQLGLGPLSVSGGSRRV